MNYTADRSLCRDICHHLITMEVNGIPCYSGQCRKLKKYFGAPTLLKMGIYKILGSLLSDVLTSRTCMHPDDNVFTHNMLNVVISASHAYNQINRMRLNVVLGYRSKLLNIYFLNEFLGEIFVFWEHSEISLVIFALYPHSFPTVTPDNPRNKLSVSHGLFLW